MELTMQILKNLTAAIKAHLEPEVDPVAAEIARTDDSLWFASLPAEERARINAVSTKFRNMTLEEAAQLP
jgi:hypothetical protein